MKKRERNKDVRLIALLVCLAMLLSVGSVLAAIAETTTDTYVQPAYVVDFVKSDLWDQFSDLHNVSVKNEGGAARISFNGNGTSTCDDPYFLFPIPTDSVNLATHHYMAMLVKTNYTAATGELRFKATTTGDYFPCQRFSYANTANWQLIVVDLTALSSLLYYDGTPVTGDLTLLRLDPFNNSCSPSVEYSIKAYGLYDNAADAQTFINFRSAHVVDFASYDVCNQFPYFNNTAALSEDGAARIYFANKAGTTSCPDPYFALPLPADSVDLATYHYMAMVVKTSNPSGTGEIRFETPGTSGYFPCQRFSYAATTDWQLIVVDLTDLNTVLSHSGAPITGKLTHLRLDPFASCSGSTEYAIKAYALFSSAADAQTLIHFKSNAQEGGFTVSLPNIDYSSYWRGAEFATPNDSYRMGFVEYGYNELYQVSVDKLLQQGYNTVVSNVNFNQQYLKDEAEFDLLRRAYEYADGKGMSTWIYDEYQWPSGKAYGLVLEGHDEYEATGIEHRTVTGHTATASYTISGGDIRIMDAVLTDGSGTRQVSFTNQAVSAQTTGSWRLDVYVLRKTYEGVEDPTDFTTLRDVNLLNPNAVSRFIDVTYAKYRDTFGESFGVVEAFFTDEPQLGNRAKANYAVWNEGLAEAFKAQYGYDLKISSIFSGDTDQDKLTRLHYYQLAASLFKTSYADQITAWCEANGTKSSGHFLYEENMNDHVETYGGDFLQLVGSMSIPGLDLLLVDPDHVLVDNNIGNVMGMRYTKSAAKNASKSDVMAEWNPGATQMPAFVNDELGASLGGASIARLCGVNVFQVIDPFKSYTNTEINTLNLYIARMNALLDGTREMGDVAVFYPIATVQAYHNADNDHSSMSGGTNPTKAYQINEKYTQMCLDLLQNQILFTVVDDQSLSVASVTNGGHLAVGEGVYKTVIVPYAEYMSVEAAQALARFANAGGRVIFVETKPTHATAYGQDGTLSTVLNQMPSSFRASFDATLVSDLLGNTNHLLTISNVSGMSKDRLLYGDFTDDIHEISFVVNSSDTDGTMTLSYKDGYADTYFVYDPSSAMIREYTGTATITIPRYQGVFVVRYEEEPEQDTTTENTTAPVEPAVLVGDVNNDGVINTKDLTRLTKYLSSNFDGSVEVPVPESADLTGDGVINVKDLIRLKKYLSSSG